MKIIRIIFLFITLVTSAVGCMKLNACEPSEPADISGAKGNVVFLGDSNTWLGGDDCTDPAGWTFWLLNGDDVCSGASGRSYARSGATWCHTDSTALNPDEYTEKISHDNVIYNQIMRLKFDLTTDAIPTPATVFIAAGTNDAWFAHRRPMAFADLPSVAMSMDEAEIRKMPPSRFQSLAKVIRYDLSLLRETLPGTRIILLTPTPSVKVSPEMLTAVSDIIEAVGRGADVEVIRMDRLIAISTDKEVTSGQMTTDGTHLSQKGAMEYAGIVKRYLTEEIK